MKIEVLERVDNRWRVRVELPLGPRVRGYTLGFVGEDGRPLGPAVVAEAPPCVAEVAVRGPCTLPAGAVARVELDREGCDPEIFDVMVARRRGLHAWLAADARLPLATTAELRSVGQTERRRLAAFWCWLEDPDDVAPVCCDAEAVPHEVRDLLAEFGVDADSVSDDLRSQLRGTGR